MSRLSSTARSDTPSGSEWTEEPGQRSGQRANREHEAEAHRKQQRSFRRDAITGKDRNHGEFSQSPAAYRDRNDYHAGHDYEQDHRIGKRQREALRPSYRPNDNNGECVNETSNAQDQGPLRPEKNAMDVCSQCCEPAGIAPPSKWRNDFRRKPETQRASKDERAVHDEYH